LLSSKTATIFDPMGFLGPFLITAKLLLRDSWKEKTAWDEVLPEPIMNSWKEWLSQLATLGSIKPPRWIGFSSWVDKVELHGFSDASQKAYAGAVYLVLRMKDGSAMSHLIIGKTRVAPLKEPKSKKIVEQTLPRLELLGALILSRLVLYVLERIKSKTGKEVTVTCWTDSTATLCWVRQPDKKWQTFVENRVTEIAKNVKPECWRHIPGPLNPADMPSRGISAADLRDSKVWFEGPEFLLKDQSHWPEQKLFNDSEKEFVEVEVLAVRKVKALIDERRFSNFNHLLRIIAYVRRFISLKVLKEPPRTYGSPTGYELFEAEKVVWRWVQSSAFHAEIQALTHKKKDEKIEGMLSQFNPFLDKDGIIRAEGRLQASLLPEQTKTPIILPSDNNFVRMMIVWLHIFMGHPDVSGMMHLLRCKFQILHIRKTVRECILGCIQCRRFKAKAASQIMASLPSERVREAMAFEVIGVDFAGPFWIKENSGVAVKSWAILFTCAVTRGIHLELVTDMSTETFMAAFERFRGEKGLPRVIYSDNGKQLKAADRELRYLWRQFKEQSFEQVKDKLKEFPPRIEWKFIEPHSPWWGGFWERMVRSVKEAMRKVLKDALLTEMELLTVFKSIQAQVNSRPLCVISDSAGEPLPITPAHLFMGRSMLDLPPTPPTWSERDENLNQRWLNRELLKSQFFKRWTMEYLPSLSPRAKWRTVRKDLAVDDVVLISDKKRKRREWPLGRIVELRKSKDGRVRAVRVLTDASKEPVSRPIQEVYRLEAADNEDVQHVAGHRGEGSTASSRVEDVVQIATVSEEPQVEVATATETAEAADVPDRR
jgi:hypothetical protein